MEKSEKKKEQENGKKDLYNGFEIGPIRPPSEAKSLLLRLTRNCAWNHCTFCGIHKNREFSIRSVEHILRDIDYQKMYIEKIKQVVTPDELTDNEVINALFDTLEEKDRMAFNAAMHWYAFGMKTVFLQDADALVMEPDDLVRILNYLKESFPGIERITSYARSDTIDGIKLEDLKRLADAGLDLIHVGMESGSDRILKQIQKGTDKACHIRAGLKVKTAGITLSEYVMPGLGSIEYSIEHAMETASALNIINPDFIRIRTLAVTWGTPLATLVMTGEFEKPTDAMIAKELRLFIESLDGIDSHIKSDHIMNLFETISGKMPHDKEEMVRIIDRFFQLPPEMRVIYQIGRRMGFFRAPEDMERSPHVEKVRQAVEMYGVTTENVDSVIDELMRRFV